MASIHKVTFVSLVTLSIQTEIQDWSHYIFSFSYSLKNFSFFIHSSIHFLMMINSLSLKLLPFGAKIFVMSIRKQYKYTNSHKMLHG